MNEIEIFKKEYLIGKVLHLDKLKDISEGYAKHDVYQAEQNKTVDELVTLIKNEPVPLMKRIKIKIINWLISKLN